MKRLNCLVVIFAYIICTAIWVTSFLLIAHQYGFEQPFKLFSFIVIWFIISAIISVLFIFGVYAVDDFVEEKKTKKNGTQGLSR